MLAADRCGVEYTFLGGTSMSSPHSAGSGALNARPAPHRVARGVLLAIRPPRSRTLSPSTAGTANVVKEDGVTPADWFDMGSGRIALGGAAMAGLALDGKPARTLPPLTPTMVETPAPSTCLHGRFNCVGTCVFTRTVDQLPAHAVDWTATSEAPAGLTITVSPSTFTLPGGGSQEVVITVDTSGSPVAEWQFVNVYLTPSDPVAAPTAPVSANAPVLTGPLPKVQWTPASDADANAPDVASSVQLPHTGSRVVRQRPPRDPPRWLALAAQMKAAYKVPPF